MPKSTSNQSFSQTGKADRDSGIQKMQQQADNYTRKYEWERRNLVTLQTVAANLETELKNTKNSLAKLKKDCEQGQIKHVSTLIKNLQKNIDIFEKKHNDTLGEIQKIKKDIDLLRQEKALYKTSLRNMEQQIQRAQAETQKLYTDIQYGQNNSKTSQNIILDLKMKNQQDKSNYYKKLNQLNKNLRDTKIGRSRVKTDHLTTIPNDTATLLKRRLTKLILNNKEKIKLIDNYQRNMKIIDEAFNTIKEATGLTDIEEIQNTFIKGQQQNYGLLTYVDVLNQQIDNFVDNNEQLSIKIQKLQEQNEQKKKLSSGIPDSQKKRKNMQEIIKKKQQEINKFQEVLNEIQPSFQDLMIKLAKSKFNTKYPNKAYQYQNGGINLNESSLDHLLSQLQQYTNQILFFKGKLANQTNSQIFVKTLLIDEIPIKDFRKKVIENINPSTLNEQTNELTKQLFDKKKLQEIAQREIEKQKNVPNQKPKKK